MANAHYIQRLRAIKRFAERVYDELSRTRAFVAAAALAFYSLLSLVPLLMILSVILSYFPTPHLFNLMLGMMGGGTLPAIEIPMLEQTVATIFSAHRGSVLSFGLLGYIWSATGGFSAAIEALDIAYDVQITRNWWKERLQSLLLILTTGSLNLLSFLLLIAGPRLMRFMSLLLAIPVSLERVWPGLRVVLVFFSFVFAVEILYYLGPNRKQSFRSTFPGALIAVAGWFAGSLGFNFYVHFANYNKTYGPLGTIIVLMLWLYIVSVSVLTGAEANAELLKSRPYRPTKTDSPFDRPIPGIHSA